MRTHLHRLAQSTGKVDERLEKRLPRGAESVWRAFLQLSGQRQSGMATNPIALTEIEAWCRLQRVTLTPWELDTLLEMDAAALNEAGKK